jgi:hypothetical protein
MKWTINWNPKYKWKTEWHKWFAWYPVTLKWDGDQNIKTYVWLEYVYRKGRLHIRSTGYADKINNKASWWSYEYKSFTIIEGTNIVQLN